MHALLCGPLRQLKHVQSALWLLLVEVILRSPAHVAYIASRFLLNFGASSCHSHARLSLSMMNSFVQYNKRTSVLYSVFALPHGNHCLSLWDLDMADCSQNFPNKSENALQFVAICCSVRIRTARTHLPELQQQKQPSRTREHR